MNAPRESIEEYIDGAEASKIIGCTKQNLRATRNDGRLKDVRFFMHHGKNRYFYHKSDIKIFAAAYKKAKKLRIVNIGGTNYTIAEICKRTGEGYGFVNGRLIQAGRPSFLMDWSLFEGEKVNTNNRFKDDGAALKELDQIKSASDFEPFKDLASWVFIDALNDFLASTPKNKEHCAKLRRRREEAKHFLFSPDHDKRKLWADVLGMNCIISEEYVLRNGERIKKALKSLSNVDDKQF